MFNYRRRYTIVLSSFVAPQSPVNFLLTASSRLAANTKSGRGFALFEVPPEGAGMSLLTYPGSWRFSDGTAAGCTNYRNYTSNTTYEIQVRVFARYFLALFVLSINLIDRFPLTIVFLSE